MKYKIYTTERLCRNEGVGDYSICGYKDWWELEVTNTENRKFNKLLIIHELIECMLIEENGIEEPAIDKFDREFTGEGEPGESEDAPYHKEHMKAEFFEKELAKEFGVDWEEYCKAIDSIILKHKEKSILW